MNDDNKKSKVGIVASKTVSFIELIIGIVLVVFFGIGGIGAFVTSSNFGITELVISFIFAMIGVYLIFCYIKINKLIKTFKNYVSFLSTDPTGSIDTLASNLFKSPSDVKVELQKLIDKNYFVNAYIDNSRNCIVFPQKELRASNENVDESFSTAEIVEYKCNGCGAVNIIRNDNIAVCEYCGSELKK